MTTRALIAEIVLPGGGCGYVPRATAWGAVTAYDAYGVVVVAGQLDFLNVVVQYPLEQFVRQDSGSVRPSVFFRPSTDKPVGFCSLLEILIVVCTNPATILDVGNLLIVLVGHFME